MPVFHPVIRTPRQARGKAGWFVLQCPFNKLNSILSDRRGLGRTGEVYCVNAEQRMVTQSRFRPELGELRLKVETRAVSTALKSGSGQHVIRVYRRRRGIEVAERVLGGDYAGTLIHVGWAPYDRFWRAAHQQCLAHLLRRCTEMIEAAMAGAVRFPRQVKELLTSALDLRDRRDARGLSEHELAVSVGRLGKRLDRFDAAPTRASVRWTRTDRANERLAKHLYKHRDQLFTVLRCPGIDATNWRREQAIRPAVVNRKIWGGNRTPAGAEAQSILMTVLRTCARQRRDALDFVSRTLHGQRPRLALAPT